MSFEEKEMVRYLDGLVVLFHLINSESDLDKASDVIHDLLLGYEVVRDHSEEFEKGYKDIEEIFIDFPRQEDKLFNKNESLKNYIDSK